MGQFYETLSPSLIEWIMKQKMFTVATAPLSGRGHINTSPKGGEYFGVVDERTFWYLELTGSGNETVSHLYEPGNGRVTVMFMAFEGGPRILRLYGRGRCLENGTGDFDDFVRRHRVQTIPGARSIILVDVHQVGTSCGFSVPFYDFKEFRLTLNDFFRKKKEKEDAGNDAENIQRYWAYKNAWSVDGLPGMHVAQKTGKAEKIVPLKKMVGACADPCYSKPHAAFTLEHLLLVAVVSALLSAIAVLHGSRIAAAVTSVLPSDARQAILAPLATVR